MAPLSLLGNTTCRGNGRYLQPASPTENHGELQERTDIVKSHQRDCSSVLPLRYETLTSHVSSKTCQHFVLIRLFWCLSVDVNTPIKSYKLLSCIVHNQYLSFLPSLGEQLCFSEGRSQTQRLRDLYHLSKSCLFLSLLVQEGTCLAVTHLQSAGVASMLSLLISQRFIYQQMRL